MAKEQQHHPHNPALDPQPVFAPCPSCTALLLLRTWINHTGWRALPEPQNPVTGSPHRCQEESSPCAMPVRP